MCIIFQKIHQKYHLFVGENAKAGSRQPAEVSARLRMRIKPVPWERREDPESPLLQGEIMLGLELL